MNTGSKSDVLARIAVSIIFALILCGATWLLVVAGNYREALVYGAATVLFEAICWWPARRKTEVMFSSFPARALKDPKRFVVDIGKDGFNGYVQSGNRLELVAASSAMPTYMRMMQQMIKLGTGSDIEFRVCEPGHGEGDEINKVRNGK